ncbi:MAG: transcription initiation protein [Nocardioidaceae bacterium]|nr:transcription initiation protein [Nocardioidaceae bacterium]
MTEYAVLLPGEEARWEQATPEQRAATYDRHGAFMAALAERGHTMTGGAELTSSSQARVVRSGPDGVSVSEGPYAETVEQLTGFYLVRSDDLDDLLQVVGMLAEGGGGVEVRACVPGPGSDDA